MPKVQSLEHGGESRRGRSRRVTSSLAEINVVPLVDVMLVLLIIFMVTAPMLQRGLDVNLPVARRAQQISDERIFINVPLAYRTSRVVFIGEEPVRVDILDERVRQALLTSTSKQVFLRGDGGVQLQDLMDVMDKLKAGGVERVGIVAKLPGER
ncbi:MAG TPA: biopolymer transporter ExbD [Vicinamibacterales bacterium]|nr:biopolymer transporter ExbD [Vicinamibacterales bacterium]